jgi:UDPglucose 6-dehydrogenase
MSGRVCVYGLWHLGTVTAACLAGQGQHVIGLDPDPQRVADLQSGRPPVAEPGLPELVDAGLRNGRLAFSADAAEALHGANTLWVTFDTPVDDDDRGDHEWVREQLDRVRPFVEPGTLVVISAQVPVGFGRALERDWQLTDPTLRFASAPENLRLGTAIDAFTAPERVVIGLGRDTDPVRLAVLFGPLSDRIEWMTMESAEMTKHALNGFLALSVAYTNELARICERVGADAAEVERGLRSEPRIGNKAYVTAGAPIAGGTLARDVAFLNQLAADHGLQSPVMHGIQDSNRLHMQWIREAVQEMLNDAKEPRVAVLGLTYKAGTDTLRRSSAVDLARWLTDRGVDVRAFDPAIHDSRPEIAWLQLAAGTQDALDGADVAVVATPWPIFKSIEAAQLVQTMRHPRLVDQTGFLPHLAADPRVEYIRVGRPRTTNVPV